MITIRKKSIYLLIMSLPLLALIVVFKSYVFTEPASIFLLFILAFSTVLTPIRMQSLEVAHSYPVLLQVVFIIYLALRVDAIESDAFRIVFQQILYLLTFTVAAIYSNNNKPMTLISLIAFFYLLAFVFRVSLEFATSREGYNLWSGFVLFSLAPLILMSISTNNSRLTVPEVLFLLFCIIFLAALRARVPSVSMIILLGLLYLLPKLSRPFGSFIFLGVLFTLFYLVVFYVQAGQSGWGDSIDRISRIYFEKPLFTGREVIWGELLDIIKHKPWFGQCSNCATETIYGLNAGRSLSSHNSFIEVSYRAGLIGLMFFISILFSIWTRLYKYRMDSQVRVSAAFLISSLVFASSGVYWFSNIVMINSLAWLILGLGYGKATLCMETRRYQFYSKQSSTNDSYLAI